MTDSPAADIAPASPTPAARLEPDAIGVTQDTVIGMASSAPAVSVGLTLAALAAATAYGSGPVIVLTAIPMLIIANAYRRLNMWNAHCGILPVAAAGFLAWIIVRSLQAAPASQIWSLIGVVLLGLVMLAIARFVLRSPFFRVPRESDTPAR